MVLVSLSSTTARLVVARPWVRRIPSIQLSRRDRRNSRSESVRCGARSRHEARPVAIPEVERAWWSHVTSVSAAEFTHSDRQTQAGPPETRAGPHKNRAGQRHLWPVGWPSEEKVPKNPHVAHRRR